MEPLGMEMNISQQHSSDPLPFARSYQLEALEKAIKQNTIAYLETGSGKTLIAIMLLRRYAYLIRKPSPFNAVFLVPQVVLVEQQADAVEMHTDLNVGKYWGDMEVDFWDDAKWKQEIDKYEVLVMTPQILLNGLRHGFFKINMIKVLIIDECHHARGKHPYASIMTEFYHRQLEAGVSDLPRIFGMTASPINTKGANSADGYWQKIHELETIMNSKVYTCVSESVLAQFVPFSTPKFKFYQDMEIPYVLYARLVQELNVLKVKETDNRCTGFQHECSLDNLDLEASAAESTRRKISKIHSALIHCLDELGVLLALKAAEYLSCYESEFLMWGKLDVFGEKIVRSYSVDAFHAIGSCIPSGTCIFLLWRVSNMVLKDIRCIIFVERIITAVVLQSLFSELLPKYGNWKTKYIAGNNSGLQNQTRKKQNEIVEEFRKGIVNIIVATSILEEGLDVQACNLIIRFDPSPTVCSFIQSRGRARMQNSDYLLMVKSGDFSTHSRLKNYLTSGDVMRKESLCHASDPCSPLSNDLCDEEFYHVASTGAFMTLSSSVGLIYFYCSRLPADGYFKPTPRCIIDKQMGICTLHLPKSSPIQTVCVKGNFKSLKQKACFEACKQLHQIGALTDNLVPDIVVEEKDAEEIGKESYNDDQPIFFPPELVNQDAQESMTEYYCYLMELKQNFGYEFPVHNIILLVRSQLEMEAISVESCNAFVELPPELCDVIMSPISISTFYSFTFLPSIMHRLESLLLATSLKKMLLDHCVHNVLEAITTKKCLESFHLESLETLGDSFLKYAVCQQLFKKHQNHHEGLLSIRKDKMISNTTLCMLGCDKKLPGFIRDEPFDPKGWMVPGYHCGRYILNEETLNTRKIYDSGRRKLKSKKVADVVEALIGAYLSMGGEVAALLFMNWIGITIDFRNIPYERHFEVQAEKIVNVQHLESLLNYLFQDPSLLVEALTHGSYMLAEIPGCYQRLEFLGDSVLDYLITRHLYNKYPGISPGLLTDLRSASVNNNCYALSAVKAGLHKHILQSSQKLYKHIKETVESFQELSLDCTFGWESEKSFPKVLGDVMESLAGAIFVDSGYNKETVFRSMRPLLEPLITLETMTVHPVKELNELCQKKHYEQRKPIVSHDNGVSSVTIEVEANGEVLKHTSTASDKKMAKKLASKEILKSLKGANFC
ncbi:endoribonuclease Dicer-like protein 2-like isoform X1 [Gossypium australe]|uniref:Endoribonuclease Dicer-like protein 2-like isoform X1 n=2 Tax=Gossypium australe TaxID=47621 RepID=A0A5B6VBW4_9ROSI|nr:endoribonuclease Dicer-like protein 2-like isoform X1 [Gossypium australe]